MRVLYAPWKTLVVCPMAGGHPFIWTDMQLITPELEALMADYPLYSQENETDPLVVAKFFDPCGSATWYMTEYDPVDCQGFGLVTGLGEEELGYFSINELQLIQRPFGLTIERDLHWKPKRLSEVRK